MLNGSAIPAPAQSQQKRTPNNQVSKFSRDETVLGKLEKLVKSIDENGAVPLSPITIENGYHYPDVDVPAPAGKDYIIVNGYTVRPEAVLSLEDIRQNEKKEIDEQVALYSLSYVKYQADMAAKIQALAAASQEENRMKEFKRIMDRQAELMARDLARSAHVFRDGSSNVTKQEMEIETQISHFGQVPEDDARSPLMEPIGYRGKQSARTHQATANRLALPMAEPTPASNNPATADKRKHSIPLLNIPFRQNSPAHSPVCVVLKEADEGSPAASSRLAHPKIASPTLSAAAAAAVSTRDLLASTVVSPMQSMRKLPLLMAANSQSGLQASPSKHAKGGLRTPRRRLHQKYEPADNAVEAVGPAQRLQNQLVNQNTQAANGNANCGCSCVIQ